MNPCRFYDKILEERFCGEARAGAGRPQPKEQAAIRNGRTAALQRGKGRQKEGVTVQGLSELLQEKGKGMGIQDEIS